MSEEITNHVAGAKRRGRPPRDPNAPPKVKGEKKPATTTLLKLLVLDATEYEAFISGKPTFTSLAAAKAHADNLATEAESAGNPDSRFAVVEEHGILAATVVRKVERNFTTSRTAVAKAVEAASGAQEGTATGDVASPAEETPTAESTPSEAAPEPSRRRR